MPGARMSADLAEAGTISSKILKELWDKCFETGEDFPAVYEREKPQQISDTGELEKLIDAAIVANPKEVAAFRSGKTNLMAFFVGQVMKATRGKANPAIVNELLTKKLNG
jgi:aspartyl-tRNA(Asn)/glutamyl-tRNA(Gln) amidotransferase subunit B